MFPYASVAVTVTEPVFPAVTEPGVPESASFDVAPGFTVTEPVVAFSVPSEAETVREPTVFSVTGIACEPLSPATNVYGPGSPACGSVLVRLTVPV